MMKYTGVFTDDYTYFREIKWLKAYSCIYGVNGKNVINEYKLAFRYENKLDIEMINQLFIQVCDRQCKQNLIHGYNQVYTISGGMDSRVVLLIGGKNTRLILLLHMRKVEV